MDYIVNSGLNSNMLDMWEEVHDMYLEDFDYLDEVARQSYRQGAAWYTKLPQEA